MPTILMVEELAHVERLNSLDRMRADRARRSSRYACGFAGGGYVTTVGNSNGSSGAVTHRTM
jgi:hypothetical protein